jgi:hypothetical protein
VTKQPLNHLYVRAPIDQKGCKGMTEVMEAMPWKLIFPISGVGAAPTVSCYSYSMSPGAREARKLSPIWRAIVEVGTIIFLFYSTLLMREFTHSSEQGKSLVFAIKDIFTLTSFVVAMISALIGYIVLEYVRKPR